MSKNKFLNWVKNDLIIILVFLIVIFSTWKFASAYSYKILNIQCQKAQKEIILEIIANNTLNYKISELAQPDRTIFDFSPLIYPQVRKDIPLNLNSVQTIKIAQFNKQTTRVVIVWKSKSKFNISTANQGKKFILRIPLSSFLKDRGGKEGVFTKYAIASARTKIKKVRIEKIDSQFKITVDADGRIKYKLKEITNPPVLLVEIPKVKLGWPYKELIVEEGPINNVTAQETKQGVQIKVNLSKLSEYKVSLTNESQQIILVIGNDKQIEKKEEKEEFKKEGVKEEKKEVKKKSEKEKEVKEKEPTPSFPEINKIELSVVNNKLRITIGLTSMTKYNLQERKLPSRLELSFSQAILNLKESVIIVNQGPLTVIRAWQKTKEPQPSVNVFMDLKKLVKYELNLAESGKDIYIDLEIPKGMTVVLPKEVKEEKRVKPKVIVKEAKEEKKEIKKKKKKVVKKAPVYNKISKVTTAKLPGKLQINIVGSQPVAYKLKELAKPDKILIEIYNAVLGFPKREIKLNYGAIKRVRVYQYKTKPINISRIVIDLYQKVKHQIKVKDNQLIVVTEAPKVKKKVKKPKPTKITKLPAIPLPPSKVPTMPPMYSRTITMDFKEADVRDVLRILAEMSGLNIVVAGDVPPPCYPQLRLEGTTTETSGCIPPITLALKNVPLEQALDMIINISNLKYRVVGDSLIVAMSQDTLNTIGGGVAIGDLSVETFAIKGYTRDEFKNILSKVVPEVTPIDTQDRPNDTITCVGPKGSLARVRNLIENIKPVPLIDVETYSLSNLNPDDVETALKKAIPEATVVSKNSAPNLITIAGSKYTLDKVKKFLADLNLKPIITYKTFQTRETKPEDIEKLLKEVLPGVNMVKSMVGTDTYSITLSGTDADLSRAETLITNLEGGTDRASLAYSVEVFKLKNMDTIAALQETEGQNIEDLLKKLVPGLSSSASSITMDTRSNSLIVKATPSDIEKVRQALTKIDIKLPQVSIECQVLDLSQSASKEFSLSWTEKAETPGEDVRSTHPPGVTITPGGDTPGAVGISFNALKAKFDLGLTNLISQGKARVLASPKVIAISGKVAKITLTDNIPYTESKQTTTEGGAVVVTQETKIQEVGITLEITPRVNEDKTITLNVHPTVQTITGQIRPNQPVATNKREVETLLRIKDGRSIVIGGLINTTERESMSKIPILANLPIIGKLFSSKSRVSSDSEVIIIITARIIKE